MLDRQTGNLAEVIDDPHYHWSGYRLGNAPVIADENLVTFVQSGYLTAYDIANVDVKWANGPNFTGQSSADKQYIYGIQNGALVVINKADGSIAWNWSEDSEHVTGQIIITSNIVFVTTEKNVYAISKETHQQVWSYPVNQGIISLGMGHLFIADKLSSTPSKKFLCIE